MATPNPVREHVHHVTQKYCTISFNSARGGQGDRLDEIWTSAILRWTGDISQNSAKVKVRPLVLVVLACDAELTPELSVILQRQWTSSDMQLKLYLDSNEEIFTKKRGQGANTIEIN